MDYLGPISSILPEVKTPIIKPRIEDRIQYTGYVLLVFLGLCQTPLFGINPTNYDPLSFMRAMMASNRFSLMELGISPIVTSGMIMQVLQSMGIIEVNMSEPKERAKFNAAQKFFGLIFTFLLSTFYVMSGMYGSPRELGIIRIVIIISQLLVTGFILLLLDDLINKGYGIGSGTSLFIAAGICESIFWKSLSPRSVGAYPGPGAIISFLHLIATEPIGKALYVSFFRQGATNLTALVSTIFIFLVVTFFQGFRVPIKIQNKQAGKSLPNQTHDIKLFYTSNMPIIILSAIVSNFFLFSQLLSKSQFGESFIVQSLGQWERYGGSLIPIGGLSYFMSPPMNFGELVGDPFHSIVYMIFVLGVTAFFSYTWVPLSGQSSKDIANQFKQNNVIIPGHTRDGEAEKHLDNYIPVAAIFGGMCIGALSVSADFIGAIGSGTGILLATTTIYQIWETIQKEGLSDQSALGFISS